MIATVELGETTSIPSFLLRSLNVTQTGARGHKMAARFRTGAAILSSLTY